MDKVVVLPAPFWPTSPKNEPEERARGDGEVDAVDGEGVAETFGQPFDVKSRRHKGLRGARGTRPAAGRVLDSAIDACRRPGASHSAHDARAPFSPRERAVTRWHHQDPMPSEPASSMALVATG